MVFRIENFLDALRLKETGTDRYVAENLDNGHAVLYGGQILAQSVAAACAGHEGKTVKTLHTVFARAGSGDRPVEITVDRLHSGRAMASSTVTVSQGERLCARSQALLTADEPDFIRHSGPVAPAAGPERAAPSGPRDQGDWEVRVADGVDIRDPAAVGPAVLDVWIRFPDAPVDDPVTAQALLAYASDGFLIGTAMRPHAGVGQELAHRTISTGVLSHTLTFHEPFSAADWLVLAHRSPYAGRGRSYGSADVFGPAGRLVASFVQDSMIRPMPARSSPL